MGELNGMKVSNIICELNDLFPAPVISPTEVTCLFLFA